MKKILKIFAVVFISHVAIPNAYAIPLELDLADPMFLERTGDFVSRTSIDSGSYWNFRQVVSYGFSDRFTASADIRYRAFGNDNVHYNENGLSGLGIRGMYRAGQGATGATDIIFGYGFGGHGVVPQLSDDVYSVGVRTGRQWSGMTLAATIMTNWIFSDDPNLGMAYIDLTPEMYLRLKGDWSVGVGGTYRKATLSALDQTWMNMMFGKTIGSTGWFFNVGYELEHADLRLGMTMNMLF